MAHKEHHEELENDFGPENYEGEHDGSYGDEDDEDEHHENHKHNHDEINDEDELEEDELEEEGGEEDKSNKLKKYGLFSIGGALLAGVAYMVFGYNNQQTPKPDMRPALHAPTAMTPQNNLQNQIQRPNVHVANGAVLMPQQNAQNNQIENPSLKLPSVNNHQQSNRQQIDNNINHASPQYPSQGNLNNYHRTSDDNIYRNGHYDNEQDIPEERNSIPKIIKDIHDDIHKTSEDNKNIIMKRVNDMQEELEEKIKSGNSISNGETQISGIRDMISALKQSLDNANNSIKSQQDTITTLRTELNSMKQKESDEQAKKDSENLKNHKGQEKIQKQKSSVKKPISHAKTNDWTPSDWKLRGYNSAKNVVIIQSPKNDYFEESIGYEARDDHGKTLSGVGKLNGVEKLPSGVYVLHTSLGEIMEGS